MYCAKPVSNLEKKLSGGLSQFLTFDSDPIKYRVMGIVC